MTHDTISVEAELCILLAFQERRARILVQNPALPRALSTKTVKQTYKLSTTPRRGIWQERCKPLVVLFSH